MFGQKNSSLTLFSVIRLLYWTTYVFFCMWGAVLPGITVMGITLFPLRIIVLITIVFDFLYVLAKRNGKVKIDKNDYLVLAFWGVGLITVVWSCNKEASFSAVMVYLTAILVYWQAKAKASNGSVQYQLFAIYINIVIMGIAALYESFTGKYLVISYEYYLRTYNILGLIRPKAAFFNTNNLAVFLTISLPLGILASERLPLKKVFGTIIIAFSSIIIILTGSRMGIIAFLLFCALLLLYWAYGLNRSKKILGIIIALFVVSAVLFFIPSEVWRVFEGTNLTNENRWIIWKSALRACKHYIFMGSGIGTSKFAYGSLGSAHNYLLEILLEFGIAGLILFLGIVRMTVPSIREAKTNLTLACFRILFWMFALGSICASTMQGYYYLWLYWGIAFSSIKFDRQIFSSNT